MKMHCVCVVVLVLTCTLSLVECDCMAKLDHCENTIEKQIVKLIKDKKVQDTIHTQVCDKFADFVACVGQLQSECDSLGKYRKNLCERRAVKLNSYRYTWRYDFIHNLCAGNKHADFFKQEKCISEVLNRKDLSCDTKYSALVRNSNVPEVCTHWDNLRECIKAEVATQCTKQASNTSDFMFHTHGNYFSKYQLCHRGEAVKSTKCWIDMPRPSMTTDAGSLSRMVTESRSTDMPTTTTTTDVSARLKSFQSDSMIDDSNKSSTLAKPNLTSNHEERTIVTSDASLVWKCEFHLFLVACIVAMLTSSHGL